MIVKTIEGFGDLNHSRKEGTLLDQDTLVYFLVKYGYWHDMDDYIWRITCNPNEGFYISCYDDGFSEECKTMEALVETLKLILEGSL